MRILVTNDDGINWDRVTHGRSNTYSNSVVFDPSFGSQGILFGATRNSGVFRSVDGGYSWEMINRGLVTTTISSLAISPTYRNDRLVFVGTGDDAYHIADEINRNPSIGYNLQGYFNETLKQFPNRSFSFVHLDCDAYLSYKVCMEFFYPRLSVGGIMLFDEYNDPAWPGCNKAIDEYFEPRGVEVIMIEKDNYRKWYIFDNIFFHIKLLRESAIDL